MPSDQTAESLLFVPVWKGFSDFLAPTLNYRHVVFYFTELTPKPVFARVAKQSYTKENANFLLLLCLTIVVIQLILVRQTSGQKCNFFPSRFASDLMLTAGLLGMI